MAALFAILPLASSFAVDLEKRASDVDVTLSSLGGTVVKASITNNAKETLKFLKSGTFLDSGPVEKATVFKDGAPVAFKGVLKRVKTEDISEEAFASLAPGATLETTFEVAAVNDLSAGGNFELVTEGAVPLASAGSTELSGSQVTFRSNKLSINVDGSAAARVAPAVRILNDRTIVTSCAGAQGSALNNALANSKRLSDAAAAAAQSGSAAKFQEYFKTTASTARNTVAARFRGVSGQSVSGTNGSTRVLAYALPSQNVIANCPIYYSGLPALTNQCHRQDQATTTLHEFTHTPATYSPGTQDNGYGYAASTALTSQQAINNADSYALYANAIYVGC
ncbi:MAG: hypothetical protein Q9171_006791 [Xanthocarpia ochracea]